jgi:hypothetical protein
MWVLKHSCRHVVACLAALAMLTACESDGGNSDATLNSESSTTADSPVVTTASTQGPRLQKWIELQIGDCLADPPPADPGVVTVSVVDCAIPHSAEVYLRADVEVNAAIADVADQQCGAGLAQYTGLPAAGPFAVTYLIDSNQDRTSANPLPSTVICLLQASNGGPLTGSARR